MHCFVNNLPVPSAQAVTPFPIRAWQTSVRRARMYLLALGLTVSQCEALIREVLCSVSGDVRWATGNRVLQLVMQTVYAKLNNNTINEEKDFNFFTQSVVMRTEKWFPWMAYDSAAAVDVQVKTFPSFRRTSMVPEPRPQPVAEHPLHTFWRLIRNSG